MHAICKKRDHWPKVKRFFVTTLIARIDQVVLLSYARLPSSKYAGSNMMVPNEDDVFMKPQQDYQRAHQQINNTYFGLLEPLIKRLNKLQSQL